MATKSQRAQFMEMVRLGERAEASTVVAESVAIPDGSTNRTWSAEERTFLQTIRLRLSQESLNFPFAQHATIYSCVHAIASNISQLPQRIRAAHRPEGQDVENRMQALHDAPNPLMSASDFIYFILVWLELSGECIIVKQGSGEDGSVSNPTEIPTELWPINGRLFYLDVDKDSKLVRRYILNKDQHDERVFLPHEVIPIRLPNPYSPYRGLPPLSAAMAAAKADWLAYRFNKAYLENSGDPGGVILYPKEVRLTPDQKDSTLSRWEDRHKGDEKRGRVGLLDRGATYQSFSQTHQDMEFAGQRRWNREEIMQAFRCPPGVIGIYEMVNYATARQESADFWTKTLRPLITRIQDAFWSHLYRWIAGGRFTFLLDTSDVPELKDDLDKQIAIAERMVNLGWTAEQVNERLALGMPINRWQKHAWADLGRVPFETLLADPEFGVDKPAADPNAPAGVPGQDVQAEALNGTQTQSLLEILAQVSAGELNPDSAKVAISIAFPSISPARIDALIDPIIEQLTKEGPKKPEPPPGFGPPGAPPNGDPNANPPGDNQGGPPQPPAGDAKPTDKPDGEKPKPPPPPPPPASDKGYRRTDDDSAKARGVFWAREIKEHYGPEEKRFLGMMRRYFVQLRAHQLALLASKLKDEKQVIAGKVRDVAVFTTKADKTENLLFDFAKWKEKLTRTTTPYYSRIATESAKRLTAQVAGKMKWSPKDARIRQLTTSLASNVTSVNKTVREQLQRTIGQGIRAGEGLTDIQERVRKVFNVASSRSLAIARTETGSATNRARMIAMGAEKVKRHTWVSSRDDNVRESHSEGDGVDGETVVVGEEFSNGLICPHDPDGDAEEVVNCRCLTLPEVDMEID